MSRLSFVILLGILSVATVLRFYNIAGYTEFRGDQGRAGLVALKAFRTGEIPLAGPTTLKNQHLGPFFYYLSIVLFGIGNFNPLVPALGTALLGIASVFLLFFILKKIVSTPVALATSLLWAVSPEILHQDRIFWEPHFVPFFSLVYLYTVVMILIKDRIRYWLLLGASCSILFQLHFFNIFFPMISLFLLVKKLTVKRVAAGLSMYILLLSPFLLFEIQTGWRDLREIGSIIFTHTASSQSGKRLIISDSLDYAGRIIGFFLPFGGNGKTRERAVLFLLTTVTLWIPTRRNKNIPNILAIWSLCWILFGSLAMGMYRETVFNHYLMFLIPPIIILIATMLQRLQQQIHIVLFVFCIFGISLIQLRRLPTLFTATYDLDRTQILSRRSLAVANDHPFALTVYPTISYSDLHYRYYFELFGRTPSSIKDPSVRYLIVICDTFLACSEKFPEKIPVLCYENHCNKNYGEIHLKKEHWNIKKIDRVPHGIVFLFEKVENNP